MVGVVENQAGEGEVGVSGEVDGVLGERFVSVCGHEKARRVRAGKPVGAGDGLHQRPLGATFRHANDS